MPKQIRFSSINNENIAYVVTDTLNFDRSNDFSDKAFQYDTYKDGLTHHSPQYKVYDALDFLLSLCSYLKDNSNDRGIINGLFHRTSKRKIIFSKKVMYKKEKIQYYSVDLQKISSSDKVRYDKRYHEIFDFHNGKFKSMYLILCTEHSYYGILNKLFMAYEMRRTMQENNIDIFSINADFESIGSLLSYTRESIRFIFNALEILDFHYQAYKYDSNATSGTECLLGNYENVRKAELKQAA